MLVPLRSTSPPHVSLRVCLLLYVCPVLYCTYCAVHMYMVQYSVHQTTCIRGGGGGVRCGESQPTAGVSRSAGTRIQAERIPRPPRFWKPNRSFFATWTSRRWRDGSGNRYSVKDEKDGSVRAERLRKTS